MGIPVLVLGESGTGKSASMRNFKKGDINIVNVARKPLPFKGNFESIESDNYKDITKYLKTVKAKSIVIDDVQYLMANEFMRRATERGFDKFTEIAQNMWSLVQTVINDLPHDTVVYFLAHIERDANGNEKIKTIGKLLDEKITVEGMFTIVLKTNVTDGQFSFLTQNSGHDTVKSPIGMFPSYAIDNDLKYVDDKIRNYYEIGEFLSDEDIAAIDEDAKKVDVIKPSSDGKKRRSSRAKKEETVETSTTDNASEPAEDAPKTERKRRTKKAREETKNFMGTGQEEPKIYTIDDEPKGDASPAEDVEEKAPRKRRSRKSVADDGKGVEDVKTQAPAQEESAPRQRKRRARS